MRSSRLPVVKTLADFDFSFQPSLKREQIESLHTLGFLERRENRGNSYRMKNHAELYAVLTPRTATAPAARRRRTHRQEAPTA
jgi:IstB-like ATP binding protein